MAVFLIQKLDAYSKKYGTSVKIKKINTYNFIAIISLPSNKMFNFAIKLIVVMRLHFIYLGFLQSIRWKHKSVGQRFITKYVNDNIPW